MDYPSSYVPTVDTIMTGSSARGTSYDERYSDNTSFDNQSNLTSLRANMPLQPTSAVGTPMSKYKIDCGDLKLQAAGYPVQNDFYHKYDGEVLGYVFHPYMPLRSPVGDDQAKRLVDKVYRHDFGACPQCTVKLHIPVLLGDAICSDWAKHHETYGRLVTLMQQQIYNGERYIGPVQVDSLVDNHICQAPKSAYIEDTEYMGLGQVKMRKNTEEPKKSRMSRNKLWKEWKDNQDKIDSWTRKAIQLSQPQS